MNASERMHFRISVMKVNTNKYVHIRNAATLKDVTSSIT